MINKSRKYLFVSSKQILYFFVSILFYFSAFGGSYYVDNSGSPACDDNSGNGTESKPWCTINYGIASISGGDELLVKRGIYHEDVYVTRPAGNSSKNTEIKTYPGHTVTLHGDGVNSGRVKIANTSYITFEGFKITNYNQGLFVENSDHISVQNLEIYNVGQEGMHIKLDSSYVTIQNSSIHDTRAWQYNGEGIYIGTAASSTPHDSTHHITIKDNTIYNTNDECIELKPGTHDCIIEGNQIYNCLTDPGITQTWWGSIEVSEAVNGNQHWEANPNHIVRNNVIYNTKTAIRGGTGSEIYNNLIYNIKSPFNGIYANNEAGDNYSRKIYHNTVDLPSDRAIIVAAGIADVKNNIGPASTYNMKTSDTFYVNKVGANYNLAAGSPPINSGFDLTGTIPNDIEGKTRFIPADIGAYEYADQNPVNNAPNQPKNLRVLP